MQQDHQVQAVELQDRQDLLVQPVLREARELQVQLAPLVRLAQPEQLDLKVKQALPAQQGHKVRQVQRVLQEAPAQQVQVALLDQLVQQK